MDKSDEQELRGIEAQKILDNPLVKEVFQSMNESFDLAWMESKDGEQDLRERIYLTKRLLKRFEHEFKQMVITGKASKQLLNTNNPVNPTNIRRINSNV